MFKMRLQVDGYGYKMFHVIIISSGMPECKLGLNDRVLLEAQDQTIKGKAIDLDEIKFHQ